MTNSELEIEGLRLCINHVHKVQTYLAQAIAVLLARLPDHDQTKYTKEELPLVLGKSKLDKTKYMSDEETALKEAVSSAIANHYRWNSHHPEFYENGIRGMTFFDLIEMLSDWKAASEASQDGSLRQSISYNTKRFDISSELEQILINTAVVLGWL